MVTFTAGGGCEGSGRARDRDRVVTRDGEAESVDGSVARVSERQGLAG